MKKALLLAGIGLLTAGAVSADPSSLIAWTPETLRFVKNGNAEHGKALAGTCAGCHNDASANPHLDGQLPNYIYRQLQDYKNGSRKDATTVMNGLASTLSEQDMADLAAFYGQQKPFAGGGAVDDATGIAGKGDGRRMEPPCSVCHGGSGQGEHVDTPRLAGQKSAYLERTLLDYKTGIRANDIYHRMRLIAGKLSDNEIKLLADYYSRMK
jgi:cytochrome c553